MIPLLLLASEPAHAGLGSLFKAAAKLGSSAGKAAGGAAKGAGAAAKGAGVAAKGAGVGAAGLKGASMLGAAVAAERVFAHMGDDAARVGVYVASSGDDGLKVVMEGGEELAHSTGSFQRLVGELDEMAAVTPEAGVDLYVDASALAKLDELALGPNTRLFLANTDGPSLPLRVAADGAAEIGASGERVWIRVAEDVALEGVELAIDLADAPVDPGGVRVLVTDEDCGEVPGSLDAIRHADAGDLVVVLGPVPDSAVRRAQEVGFDVVAPGIVDPCPPGGGDGVVRDAMVRIASTKTVGELWAVGQVDVPLVVSELEHEGAALVVRGAGFLAVHVLGAVGGDDPGDDGELPVWVTAPLGLAVVVVLVGLKLRKASAR